MENINLIRKIAWSFNRTTGLEWDDLFQEAALAYLEAKRRYDPTRHTKFTTFAYITMRSALLNYVKREHKYHNPVHSLEDVPYDRNIDTTPIINLLPDDAAAVAQHVLSCPQRFCIMSTTGEAVPRLLRLVGRQGWSTARILRALHDLRMVLQTL